MKETRLIMGMPVTVEIADATRRGGVGAGTDPIPNEKDLAAAFDYFTYIDEKFSTYKPASEMMRINRGELAERDWSDDMAIIFALAEDTKQRTDGFFDMRRPDGSIDPSGIVKGWAIFQAAKILESRGFKNFYVDAGGDIQTSGAQCGGAASDSSAGKKTQWTIGIKNPLKKNLSSPDEIVKTIYAPTSENSGAQPDGIGVATSGTYIRGEHIYNPKTGAAANEIVSLTIIGPNIYEADRFATAAFAMGARGIHFIEQLSKRSKGSPNLWLEGYMIDKNGIATMTTGFETYTRVPTT
jgi:FAD:protein FMN transferase